MNKLNITKLEDTMLENVSGGKKISEAIGDFITDHPYITWFMVTSVVASICSIPATTARSIKGKSNNQ